jgi:uncharacterized protein (TIGR01627 family)
MRQTVQWLVARLCVELCVCKPSTRLLRLTRWAAGIQLQPAELRAIVSAIHKKRPCKLLVFGLGRDSLLWARVNRAGTTVFLEDEDTWLDEVLREYPGLKAFKVDYLTRRGEWKELLDSPGRLAMRLPDDVEHQTWDVVLVDAPAGFNDSNPGRMKSIALSVRLASSAADVFVHDCDRPVERAYCDHFLRRENLVEEIGRLRHYRVKPPTADVSPRPSPPELRHPD